MAKTIPMLMAAGSAGGTVIVIKSRALRATSFLLRSFREVGRVTANPAKAIKANTPINFMESAWKLNLLGFGYKMDLIRDPFIVS